MFAALVPGGVVVVQDNIAAAGSDPTESVDRLHRIDPATVSRDFERAGFKFEGSSAVLSHAEDDHTEAVTSLAIQGRTDQFLHRYRKPAR